MQDRRKYFLTQRTHSSSPNCSHISCKAVIASDSEAKGDALLAADQRAVVVLVDLQEFDYQEAAGMLGVPIGTVKSRLARGRSRLQQFLNETDKFKLTI